MKARIRRDVIVNKDLIPHSLGGFIPECYDDTIFECELPDSLNNEEYNAIITAPDNAKFYVHSIDLEFLDGSEIIKMELIYLLKYCEEKEEEFKDYPQCRSGYSDMWCKIRDLQKRL